MDSRADQDPCDDCSVEHTLLTARDLTVHLPVCVTVKEGPRAVQDPPPGVDLTYKITSVNQREQDNQSVGHDSRAVQAPIY